MHQSNRRSKNILRKIDFFLLLPAVFLVLISLFTLLSINPIYFRQQLISLILGIFAFLLFLVVDVSILKSFSKLFYGIIIFFLILLHFFGIEVNGARSWFDIFGLRLQVSELAKPFFLIILASYLSGRFSQRILKFFGALLLITPIFLLIARQPDLGTGVIYATSSFLVIMLARFPKRYIFGSILSVIVIFPIVFHFLANYQRQRLLTFLDITHDPTGASYNAIQSLISIGSGGVFGKGFGQGTQSLLRFLPEQHTDFIFATISEDLGFVGSVTVLILFSFLLIRIYKIAESTDNLYKYLFVMGAFALFFFQMLFNVGMNLGIMPIIGITLPFVSYGGSSLISSFIALGMISAVHSERKKVETLEIG